MCRPRRLSRRREREIGRACLAARTLGTLVPWKVLMRRYRLGRTKLHELTAAAEAEAPERLKSVREHLGAGQGALAAANVTAIRRRA